MVCLLCQSNTQVVNSRHQKRANQVWRRRQCLNCGAVFTTEEQIDYGGIWSVQAEDGSLQPFNRDELFISILNSLKHRITAVADAGGLVSTVISKLVSVAEPGMVTKQQIQQATQVALNRFDEVASVSYQAFHRQALQRSAAPKPKRR